MMLVRCTCCQSTITTQPSLLSRTRNFFCFQWPHHTPPRSHSFLTQLLALVTQFHYLLLTVFLMWLSVCNPSYLSQTVSWMYVDSLNLRQTVPKCQLTPAIALSVVPTMFGYTILLKHKNQPPNPSTSYYPIKFKFYYHQQWGRNLSRIIHITGN
jgi:hypothetical protein